MEKPYLHLYRVRCTALVFHVLVWSFLWKSDFKSQDVLNDVRITGLVFLIVQVVLALTGATLKQGGIHYLMIVLHSLGILLTLLSVLRYWDPVYLWIPVALTNIFPFAVEVLFIMLKCGGVCSYL